MGEKMGDLCAMSSGSCLAATGFHRDMILGYNGITSKIRELGNLINKHHLFTTKQIVDAMGHVKQHTIDTLW